MTQHYPNVYSMIVFDLHNRIREYIDGLNNDGQIDLDSNGYPYLIKVDKQGSNHICHIARNGKIENFILNTRKRQDPITSWADDGFQRVGENKPIKLVASTGNQGNQQKGERAKITAESYDNLVSQILD